MGSVQDDFLERLQAALAKGGFPRSERLVPTGVPMPTQQVSHRWKREEPFSTVVSGDLGLLAVSARPPYEGVRLADGVGWLPDLLFDISARSRTLPRLESGLRQLSERVRRGASPRQAPDGVPQSMVLSASATQAMHASSPVAFLALGARTQDGEVISRSRVLPWLDALHGRLNALLRQMTAGIQELMDPVESDEGEMLAGMTRDAGGLDLLDAIAEVQRFQSFTEDWDGSGGLRFDPSTVRHAVDVLTVVANLCFCTRWIPGVKRHRNLRLGRRRLSTPD